MKYQLNTDVSKNYRWLLVVISEWIVWNWIDFFTIRVECRNFLNLYGLNVLRYEPFLTIFSL